MGAASILCLWGVVILHVGSSASLPAPLISAPSLLPQAHEICPALQALLRQVVTTLKPASRSAGVSGKHALARAGTNRRAMICGVLVLLQRGDELGASCPGLHEVSGEEGVWALCLVAHSPTPVPS
jgi:hypothetical protein